jgi:hypothetical protein
MIQDPLLVSPRYNYKYKQMNFFKIIIISGLEFEMHVTCTHLQSGCDDPEQVGHDVRDE